MTIGSSPGTLTNPVPGGPPYRLIHAAASPHSSVPNTVVTPAGDTDQLSRHRAGRPRLVLPGVARTPLMSKIAASWDTPSSSLGAGQAIAVIGGNLPVSRFIGKMSGGFPDHTTLPPASR